MNPVTGEAVVRPGTAQAVLAMMTIAGMYETSGDGLLDVGVRAASLIGERLSAPRSNTTTQRAVRCD